MNRSHLLLPLVLLFLCINVLKADPPKLKFIENKGQWPKGALFGADIPGGNFYLSKKGFSYLLYDTEDAFRRHHGSHNGTQADNQWSESAEPEILNMHLFHAEFVNASFSKTKGSRPLSTDFNYYFGNNPGEWVSKAKGYTEMLVEDLYDHIDMKIMSAGFNMKYDMIVHEGGDTEAIKVKYGGVDDIYIEHGDLLIETSVGQVSEYRPYAYQLIDGEKVEVPSEYSLEGTTLSYRFPMGYNECYDLIIDPLLIFSTYSGSAADNWGNTATFGEHGKLYSGGITNHFRNGNFLGEFPATAGAFQTEWGGVWDLAIIKYDSSGSNVEYATYLGGSGSEVPVSMIMNNNEDLLIYGVTNSTDFPTTSNGYQQSFQGGSAISTILGTSFANGSDGFIVKLSSDGSVLVNSTYFGGSGNDGLNENLGALTRNYGDQQRGEIFIDDLDNVYVASSTASTDLFADSINTSSFNRTYGGGPSDALVAKFSNDLTSLDWGGYIGGSHTETGFAVKIDDENNVFVAGGTDSPDFMREGPGMDSTYNGGTDGWILRINADTVAINAGTFLGTATYDQVYFLDLDSNGDVYVLGQTKGSYPISSGVYNNPGGGQFIHKLSNDLTTTDFSTTFGTTNRFEPNISPTAFLVNDCNNLYVAGWGNNSSNFAGGNYVNLSTQGLPTTSDAIRTTTTGQDFYMMVLDAAAESLLYGTFFGGSTALIHVDGGTSRFDKSGIVYHSVCASCNGGSTFDTTPGAWSTENGAVNGCNNAAFKFDLASLRAIIQTNTVELDNPGYRHVCLPDSIAFQNFSIGGELFVWDFGDGTGLTKTDTAYITHYYENPGAYIVKLRAIDANTCVGEDQTSVIVNVYDPNQRADDDATICFGDSHKLMASGGTSYSWTSIDSTFMSNEQSPTITPEDTTTYFVHISDTYCETIDAVTINVVPSIDFEYSISKEYDCFGRPKIIVNNTTETPDNFTWDFDDGNTSDMMSTSHEYENDGTYTIRLLGQREFCGYVQQEQVKVFTVKVPNVITPGDKLTSDGGSKNDKFVIQSNFDEALKIYNRWGGLVYENDDYQDNWEGENEAAGVYYYEVLIGEETTCTGWVHLIK